MRQLIARLRLRDVFSGAIIGSIVSLLAISSLFIPIDFRSLGNLAHRFQTLLGSLATLCAAAVAYSAVLRRINFDKEMKDLENDRIAHTLASVLLAQIVYTSEIYRSKLEYINHIKQEGNIRKAYNLLLEAIEELHEPPLFMSDWKEFSLIRYEIIECISSFSAAIVFCKDTRNTILSHGSEIAEIYLEDSITIMRGPYIKVKQQFINLLPLIEQEVNRLRTKIESISCR